MKAKIFIITLLVLYALPDLAQVPKTIYQGRLSTSGGSPAACRGGSLDPLAETTMADLMTSPTDGWRVGRYAIPNSRDCTHLSSINSLKSNTSKVSQRASRFFVIETGVSSAYISSIIQLNNMKLKKYLTN